MTLPVQIPGVAPVLVIADHASNAVPEGVSLGIDPALLGTHIAVDIGTEPLARALAAELDAPAIIATVSRLVIDMNREPDVPGLIPGGSDGHILPGNLALSEAEKSLRVAAIHTPYHAAIEAAVESLRPELLLSLHSFTGRLATAPEQERPWPVGLLHNRDSRAARLALPLLAARGLHVGDNQPYSGRDLNFTMNIHAEARGLPYLAIEVRNDGLADAAGVAHWCHVIADTVRQLLAALRTA